MSKKDTKYLKFNGSSWVFQKRLTPAEQEYLGVRTKVHNKSLETDSRKDACVKRDAILLQLSKARQQDKSPQYSALLEKYQGYSKEELKKKTDLKLLNHPKKPFLSKESLKKLENTPDFIEFVTKK